MAENIRLLLCKTCGSMEELPDYEGDPRQDFLLDTLVKRHRNPDGSPHIAHPMLRVEKRHWDSPSTREEIIKRIRDSTGHTGLDPAFYDAKNTFQEDAMTCWQQHSRSITCSDWCTDKKRLTPDTAAERKAASLPKYRSSKDIYLCHFCPVANAVRRAAYDKAG
ncbi:hypothetical protein ACJ6WD_11225 [Streptomyces sp. VTCC 41912]|uniref:hypothetical protein n=1 Tax=Streptomyces sp. VTCC 41912 TaxID=3383243 RepID=UPI003896A0F5